MINNPDDYNSRNIVDNNPSIGSIRFKGHRFGETEDFSFIDDEEEEELDKHFDITPVNMKSSKTWVIISN